MHRYPYTKWQKSDVGNTELKYASASTLGIVAHNYFPGEAYEHADQSHAERNRWERHF